MSRTYRNIRYRQMWGSDLEWVLKDSTNNEDEIPWDEVDRVVISSYTWYSNWVDFWYKKDSKEGKRRIARYFSDAGTHNFKEPGPSWFRNFYVERPNRRKAKRELKKFMLNEEYEPIIDAKPPLPYWT